MIKTTTIFAAALIAGLSLVGCNKSGPANVTTATGSVAAPAPTSNLPEATANSIVLDNGREIHIPDGVDLTRWEWVYDEFTNEDLAQINTACKRELARIRESGKDFYLSKPLSTLCACAKAGKPDKKPRYI